METKNDVVSDAEKLLNQDEIERVGKVYFNRNYDHDTAYSDTNPVYLHRTQSVERATHAALRKIGLSQRLAELKILDYGCGNGRWMSRWLSWGASPENMSAADIRESALKCAKTRVSQADCRLVNENGLGFPGKSFDLVYQNLAFSSILDNIYRKHAAREIDRVLKPGGVVMWYDLIFNNPGNPDVKKVTYKEVQALFPDYRVGFSERIVLAPPIAKRVIPVSWSIADALESMPFLRTHLFVALRKPDV